MRSIPGAAPAPPAPDSAPRSLSRAGPYRRRRIYQLVKKVHLYLGLVNLSNLLIFGLVGLLATFAEGGYRPPVVGTRSVPFAVPAGLTDKQIADRVYDALHLPLTSPVPEWAVHRNAAGLLQLDFYTVNGPRHVRVLEQAERLEIETRRNSLGHFLSNLHATTIRESRDDWRLRLWTYEIELALWSLIALPLTGVYLWLASRPRYRLAVNSVVVGNALFVLLYLLTR